MMSRFVLGAPVQSTAEDLLDTAKDQVSSTLQAGQGAIRPGRLTRELEEPGIEVLRRL